VAGLASTSANAAMVFTTRAFGTYASTAFNGFAPLAGADTPSSVVAANGKVIAMAVFADVTQTLPASDVNGWPAFSSAGGRITSGPTGVKGNVFGNFLDKSVKGSGQSAGTIQDLDGDGDNDIGNTDANAASPTGWVLYRANTSTGEEGPGSTDDAGATIYSAGHAPTAIPNGFEYYLGEVDFLVTNASQPNSTVNWQFRPLQGNATWFENAQRIVNDDGKGTITTKFQGGSTGSVFSVGPGVTLVGTGGGVVPEPASLGLAGLAGLSLLARRGKKD